MRDAGPPLSKQFALRAAVLRRTVWRWRRGRPAPRNRETLIALRARRTAHRVAWDFLNPHMDVPPPPAPIPPPTTRVPAGRLVTWRRPFLDLSTPEDRRALLLALLFAGFSLVVLYATHRP